MSALGQKRALAVFKLMTSSNFAESFRCARAHEPTGMAGCCARATGGGAAEQRDELAVSFEDLVGAGEQGRRHIDPNRLCRLGVDDKFEFGWLLNRQIGRFCPL